MMINTQEYEAYVKNRQANFDAQKAACIVRGDYVSLAALYMDILTSNLGEDWDETEMYLDLDEVMEKLKENNVLFFNNPISARSKDKNDRYVLTFVRKAVPIYKEKKDIDGNPVLDSNGKKEKYLEGYRDKQIKRHVHKEVWDIKNTPKTNAYGIPAVKLSGEFFTGGKYNYISKYSNCAMRPNMYENALKMSAYTKNNSNGWFKSEKLEAMFFNNIMARVNYGLSAIYGIYTANEANSTPAGFVRLDFDTNDTSPICTNIRIALKAAPLIHGHVHGTGLISSILDYIKTSLAYYNIITDNNTQINIYTSAENTTKFEELVESYSAQQGDKVKNYEVNVEKPIEAARLHAEAEEKHRLQLEYETAMRKAKEKELAKAQREQHIQESAERKAEKLAARQRKEAEKHAKAVESVMNTLVESAYKQGFEPNAEVFTQMRNSVYADLESGEALEAETALVIEALDKLIATAV